MHWQDCKFILRIANAFGRSRMRLQDCKIANVSARSQMHLQDHKCICKITNAFGIFAFVFLFGSRNALRGKQDCGGQQCILGPLFHFSLFFYNFFIFSLSESVTDQPTDGQGLIQRCEDASKNHNPLLLYFENLYFRRTVSVIRGLSGAYDIFSVLDASFNLYKRPCPSVRRSLGPLVILLSKLVKNGLLRILDILDSAKYHQNSVQHPPVSIRDLVCSSVGPSVHNAFVKFDEVRTFLDEMKCRKKQLEGRNNEEEGAMRRKEQRGGRSHKEDRATRRMKKKGR